jgi:AraC-like DNA-binding protein
LGRFLLELAVHSWGRNLDEGNFNIEFFYACSEKIIADQIPIFKQLQSIPTVKATTKKELYRRISKGKEFIDAYFLSPLTVGTVAKAACMSEYHFFRIFKSVFNLSPNQYLIQKRLEYGLSILQQDKNSVSIAAIEAGFSDIHAFSKAFKMHFGYSPSAVMKPK